MTLNTQKHPLTAVGGLIFAPDGTILLVRSDKWSGLYTLAGGKVDCGETCEEAFKREILEETGLRLVNVRFAMIQESIHNPQFVRRSHFVMVDYVADLHPSCAKNDIVLNDEANSYLWVTPAEAKTLPINDELHRLLDWYETSSIPTKSFFGLAGVRNLEVPCIIGVNDNERDCEQTLFFTVEVEVKCCSSMDQKGVSATTDYTSIAQITKQIARQGKFFLLETLCVHVLQALINQLSVPWARISVRKPGAFADATEGFVTLSAGQRLGS